METKPSPNELGKKVFACCVLCGVAVIFCFVVFQEWGKREWPGFSVRDVQENTKSGSGEALCWDGDISHPVLKVLYWNVRNYGVAGEKGLLEGTALPKKEEEVAALLHEIVASRADVVALVEVNSRAALEELRNKLKEKGREYPYSEFLKREFQRRGMALLSRYPLSEKESEAEVPLCREAGDVSFMMRGILSVTVLCPGGGLNVMVVHLKSKVGEDPGRDGLVRRAEADVIREWAGRRLRKKPGVPLLLCGDFNDTPDSPVIRSLLMDKGGVLKKVSACDSRGERWTHYYKAAETYSQLDYVFWGALQGKAKVSSRLLDGDDVKKVSDHRPMLVIINS